MRISKGSLVSLAYQPESDLGATAVLLAGIMFGWAGLLAFTTPLGFMAMAMLWHERLMEKTRHGQTPG